MVQPKSKGVIKTYTNNADFSEGSFSGVSLAVPDQLILAEKVDDETFPYEKIFGDEKSGKGLKVTLTSDKTFLSENDTNATIGYHLSGFGESDVNENAVDLLFLIDESWSMEYDGRLDNAKKAAKEIVERMKENDRCAVIGFSGLIHDIQKFTSDKTAINKAIDMIRYANATNISRGLSYALEKFDDSDRQNILFFFPMERIRLTLPQSQRKQGKKVYAYLQ